MINMNKAMIKFDFGTGNQTANQIDSGNFLFRTIYLHMSKDFVSCYLMRKIAFT